MSKGEYNEIKEEFKYPENAVENNEMLYEKMLYENDGNILCQLSEKCCKQKF